MIWRRRARAIWVAEQVLENIREWAIAAWPDEAGGILAGVLAGSRVWVTHVARISPLEAWPSRYEIPAGATEPAIARLQKEDANLGYLGEWHSHPSDLGPSATDAMAMAAIAKDPAAGRREPLLILARYRLGGFVLETYEFRAGAIRPVKATFSGPLG